MRRHAFTLSILACASACCGRITLTAGFSLPSRSRASVPPRRRWRQLGATSGSPSPPPAAPSPAAAPVLDFYAGLDAMYDRSIAIRCPFFRRRAADLIDGAAMVGRFLLIRHKSLPGMSDLFLGCGPATAAALSAPGCKPLGRHVSRHPDGTACKSCGLPLGEVARRIGADWTGGAGGERKGYYITGRIDSTIYRDDCLFDGPDPDMPVRGLRKYLSAAAHLFDPKESEARLISMDVHEDGGEGGHGVIEARWKLSGVIQLPWHPRVEPWTGTTLYHVDEEGLIFLHEERWDVSVWRAFICTLFPRAKSWGIWDVETPTGV